MCEHEWPVIAQVFAALYSGKAFKCLIFLVQFVLRYYAARNVMIAILVQRQFITEECLFSVYFSLTCPLPSHLCN